MIRYILRNNVGLHKKVYTLKQIEEGGLKCLFDVENYEIISKDRFTGLTDKNGVKIFEGDILLIRKPERLDQTHTGDNIPLGSYTEPLEPIIQTTKDTVIFNNGSFCLSNRLSVDYYGEDQSSPLGWEIVSYTLDYAKDCFCGGWSNYNDKFIWSSENEDEGDLEYLLEEYNLKNEDELIKYLGIEVIGNIFDNPELLEK